MQNFKVAISSIIPKFIHESNIGKQTNAVSITGQNGSPQESF